MKTAAVSILAQDSDMAALLMMRRGLVQALHERDRSFVSNPGENDGYILRAVGEALLGERFDNPLLTQAAFVNSARNFKEGHRAFRQCLADILEAASDFSLGKATKEELALKVLFQNATAESLLRTASIYLTGTQNPVLLSIDEFNAKTKLPAGDAETLTLNTSFGPGRDTAPRGQRQRARQG